MNKMDARRKQILSLIYTLGLLLFCLLYDKIGTKAGGYLMVITFVLVCLFLPFFAFLPVAIEKPLRARISKGQIKNANGLWSVVFGYTVFAALILSLFMATILPAFMQDGLGLYSVGFCLPYLAPGVFFLAISRALCMYFQGKGSGLQSVIASALMIVFAVVFSFVFGTPLLEYGGKVSTLLGNPNFKEQYLMVGITIGIDIASVITFVFLFFAYLVSARESSRNKHVIRMTEHKGDSIRIFVASFMPYFIATVMMLIPVAISFVMFFEKYPDKVKALNTLGILTNEQYLPCGTVLLGVLSFVVLIVSQISVWVKKEEIRQARAGFRIGLVWIMIVSGFISVCLLIFYSWKMSLIFFFAALAYFFATLLWQSGKRKSVLISMFVSMVVSLTCSFLLSGLIQQVDLIVVVPLIALLGTLCVSTGFFLIKHFRFVPDVTSGFLFPILSSFIAGLIMYVLTMLMNNLGNGFFLIFLNVVIGFLVHLLISMVLQCGNDNEMINMPGGKIWLMIGNRLHLFH